jgi:mRNA-degrading endonuclease RelE of RelBE toxin-antitoxin system
MPKRKVSKRPEAPYTLRRNETVKKQIDELPGHLKQQIRREIDDLAYNPRPTYGEPLRPPLADRLQITIDDYRIVYKIEEEYKQVIIQKIGKKKGPEFYYDIE